MEQQRLVSGPTSAAVAHTTATSGTAAAASVPQAPRHRRGGPSLRGHGRATATIPVRIVLADRIVLTTVSSHHGADSLLERIAWLTVCEARESACATRTPIDAGTSRACAPYQPLLMPGVRPAADRGRG